jgi:hypothetical protein
MAARCNSRYSRVDLHELLEAAEVPGRRAWYTYLITNHHFRGQAVLNALELSHRLRHAPVPPPTALVAAYAEPGPMAAPAPAGHPCPPSGAWPGTPCNGDGGHAADHHS